MDLLLFLLFGVFPPLSQALDSTDQDFRNVVMDHDVTGVLGEEIYLRCLYTGQLNITFSSWNRMETSTRSRKMAGYRYDGQPFTRGGFSAPASRTNLTVKLGIDSLDLEGLYMCMFSSDDDEIKEILDLKVMVRPEIKTHVEEDILNGTQYQTVSCSASNAKPMASVRWESHGFPLSEKIFSINTTNYKHPNGTFSISSVLRFPVLLNHQSRVSCVVQHQTLTEPSITDIKLHTFVSPNCTMKLMLEQKDGKDFFQVLCTAAGGRPHPEITWILPTSAHIPLSLKHNVGSDSVASSHWFPSDLYEGENITCIFGYTLHPVIHTRTVTLPTYYIASLQLKKDRSEVNNDLLILEEGVSGVNISMEVMGNVPNYKLNCTKDGEPVLEDVDVISSGILIKGPVSLNLSGQFQCQASYHRHAAFLEFTVKVKPKVLLPVTFPPNISVHLWKEAGNVYIGCLASDACPAANVSWDLPQDLDGMIQSNITSLNGSHTVQSILILPDCLSQELEIECVVEHLDLAGKERRQITLPVCAPTNITLVSSTVWKNGVAYTEVNCSADDAPHVSTITWKIEDCKRGINSSHSHVVIQPGTQQGRAGRVQSTAHLSAPAFAGCTVICGLEHQGLEIPGRKSIRIPSISPPVFHLSVGPLRDSPLWAAVCVYRGDGVQPNISLVISEHNTTRIPVRIHPTYEGVTVLLNITYEFKLSLYEGKDFTCMIHKDQNRTAHVPKYFLSSIVVVNKTSSLRGNHEQHTAVNRIMLQKALANQKIIFRVIGNASIFNIRCFRNDGSAAHTVAMALVFTEPVSEKDAGLYTCQASWYHHNATAYVQVDVTSKETHTLTFILICFSSAAAITIFLFITLCILCKRSGGSHSSRRDRKQRESLAGLMQTPCSPDLNKTPLSGGKGPEYAELVRYSIVIDVRSTV